jgi:RimJ/RimL family protein N-acetyltransferase
VNRAPRTRLDGDETAIRPLGVGDLDEYHDLVVSNRAHTSKWDPIRPDFFYSRAGQHDQLRRDEDAWASGAGYAFAAIDRTAGERIVGRVALGNVVRIAAAFGLRGARCVTCRSPGSGRTTISTRSLRKSGAWIDVPISPNAYHRK